MEIRNAGVGSRSSKGCFEIAGARSILADDEEEEDLLDPTRWVSLAKRAD